MSANTQPLISKKKWLSIDTWAVLIALAAALLVRAGVGVMRLEQVRHSLEQRFLEVTSRLDSELIPESVKS